MQHRKNSLLDINTGVKSKWVFVRQLLTNLVRNWKVTTTLKRAEVLKSEIDTLISRLISNVKNCSEADAKRENIRLIKSVIYSEEDGKKLLSDLLPKFVESGKSSGFTCTYKMWYRKGDWAERILVKFS